MIYKNFPGTDLEVSELTLGTWVFSGDCWQEAKEQECIDAVKAALDGGINCIDTAPLYGNGRSEQIIGKAIKGRREKIILATKCGLKLNGKAIINDLTAQSIRQEVEDSLKRLGTDYIDLYQCHWPDENTPIAETIQTLKELQSAGKIRYFGVSNYGLNLLNEIDSLGGVISLQSQYSILERDLDKEIIPHCRQKKIGLLPYGVLGGGVLSGKYKSAPNFKGFDARNFFYKYYKGDAFKRVQEILSTLEEFGKPLNQTAINWVRQTEGVTSVLVGCRNLQQVKSNIEATQWRLTDEQIETINGFSF